MKNVVIKKSFGRAEPTERIKRLSLFSAVLALLCCGMALHADPTLTPTNDSSPGNITFMLNGGYPNAADFQDHVINIYDGNYYDATCGAGPYEESQSGFLQYLQENVRIRSGFWVCRGDDLTIEDFYSIYNPRVIVESDNTDED